VQQDTKNRGFQNKLKERGQKRAAGHQKQGISKQTLGARPKTCSRTPKTGVYKTSFRSEAKNMQKDTKNRGLQNKLQERGQKHAAVHR